MSSFRTLFATLLSIGLSIGNAFATSEGVEGAHHGLTPHAPVLFHIPLPGGYDLPFTNSMVMLFSAVIVIALAIRMATSKMRMIPSTAQNLVELIYEKIFAFFSNILGERLAQRTIWFFFTAFILILCSNWMGLIPGVGIITYTNAAGETAPLFRGANADLNITLAMGLVYIVLWLYWTITEIGFKGLIKDIFAPKGSFKGGILFLLIPIFLLVGSIDVISIALRPITLAARLYGNIFAGEQIIETMSVITNPFISWIAVLPFFFMELLVGFLQALVFTLLSAVFLSMICSHAHHDEEEAH